MIAAMRALAIVALVGVAGSALADGNCAVPQGRDRAALQAAMATGCTQLEAVEYTVETPSSTSARRRPYAMLALGYGELRGVPGAVLRFTGDAGGADWYGIEGNGGSIVDLAIDTTAVTGRSEQFHAIRFTGAGGAVVAASVEHVTINHPARDGEYGGDCVQLVGRLATPVIGARIAHNLMTCDRSCVAAHSSAHGLIVLDNDCTAGDQGVDGEGDGDHRDWTITWNRFRLAAAPQGDFAIQIHKADRVAIAHNRLMGQGIFLLSGSNVEVASNTIVRTTAASGVGVVQIDKASATVVVHDNTLVRAASAGPGHVIRAMPRDAAAPTDLAIRDNALIQQASGDVVHVAGVVGLRVTGNTSAYTGPAGRWYGVLVEGAPGLRAEATTIDGNTWVGPLLGSVGLDGARGVGAATLTDNVALGPLGGLVCSATGVRGPLTVGGNTWPPPACAALGALGP